MDDLLHPRWRAVFNAAAADGAEISVPCPVCSSPTLYRWYLLESERPRVLRGLNYAGPGRLWEWCANCLIFEYYQDAYVPEWWTSPYSVEEGSLRYDPGPIEEVRSSRATSLEVTSAGAFERGRGPAPAGTAGQVDPSDDPRLHLYADLVEQGGLRSAIVSIARERRLDLSATTELSEEANQVWGMADFLSRRGAMRVQLGHSVRRFAITLDSDQGFVWASGSTADLPEVVEAMAFWKEGAKLKELSDRFPFMEFDRLSQGYEDGKPVETQ